VREKNEKNRDENEGRERIKDLAISFYSQEYKRFFFLSISLLLGTKRIIHKSIPKKISAFGNKKDHTQGHQMIVLLFGLRTKRITLKSINFVFSASGNKEYHTQEHQKVPSLLSGNKRDHTQEHQ
jgi:hypothetical protein